MTARRVFFLEPSGLCVFSNLLFVCDSGNASVRVIDIARLVSRKRSAQILEACPSESVEEEEDGIPIAGKYTITSTLALVSTCQTPLIRPFSICEPLPGGVHVPMIP